MKRHAHYSTISDLSSRLGPNSLEALSVGTMRDDHVLRHLRRRKKEHVAPPLAVVLTMSGNEGETLKNNCSFCEDDGDGGVSMAIAE